MTDLRRLAIGLFVALTTAAPAFAQGVPEIAQACEDLGRPNVDCTCVAGRAAIGIARAPSIREAWVEGYRAEIGEENVREAALTAFMGDQTTAIAVEQALTDMGGMAPNLDDFEAECVIAGAPVPQIAMPQPDTPEEELTLLCEEATGNLRACACETHAYATALSPDDWTGYLAFLRGERPEGVQPTLSLVADLRPLIQARCTAMTRADQAAGFDAVARAAVSQPRATTSDRAAVGPSDLTGAAPGTVLEAGCLGQGESAAFCTCARARFETDIAERDLSDGAGRFIAYILTAGGLDAVQNAQVVGSSTREEQQEGMMARLAMQELGPGCEEELALAEAGGPVAVSAQDATARMEASCLADVDDAAICSCVATRMAETLGTEDLALVVILREAQEEADPVQATATALGLPKADIQSRLRENPALMGGEMQDAVMACLMGD
ncbi:hypothetical protein [Roseobacter sp. HKCCA0434]|uniref:hypothetical protein n=1 Tax=Roseobacter sp. HKCCA0434 TaxID=3079297 RepID=UPI002905A88C|nr:hypothetical protein [Roseobacter sp. HKCCA0434]